VKKKLKKLQLNKETLRNLDDKALQQAVGGITGTAPCSACSIACTECTVACTACQNC
jgi:natural product precursor